MITQAIQIEHLAMNTRWRMVFRGWDAEELEAFGGFCTCIIDDWDRLLNRYDPASELSRINRAKAGATLKLHRDLLDLLKLCDRARVTTHGLFEVALPVEQLCGTSQPRNSPYRLDPGQGTFTWLEPNQQLDFGGIAKGYVLDQLLQFVREHHVDAALFDAGGSSLLTWDSNPDAAPWLVTLSPPGEGPRELVVGPVTDVDRNERRPWVGLQNMALAYSATRLPGIESGQTINPLTNRELPEQCACVVVTHYAAWAEILSTTALCMGEVEAAKYINEKGLVASRLGWLAGDEVHWYSSLG